MYESSFFKNLEKTEKLRERKELREEIRKEIRSELTTLFELEARENLGKSVPTYKTLAVQALEESKKKPKLWYLIDAGTHRYWNDHYTPDHGELVTTQFSNPFVEGVKKGWDKLGIDWSRFDPPLERKKGS